MHVNTVGHLSGHPEHPRVHGGDVDRRVVHVDRPRRPRRRQQRQVVVLTLDRQRLARAERAEDRLHGEDVVAQPWPRWVERHPVTPLDMGAHLGPEPQPEAALARLRQLPRHRRGDHRAAGKGHRDAGHQVELARGRRRQLPDREVRRPPRLGHHQARQPRFGGPPGQRRPPPQRLRRQHGVELQRARGTPLGAHAAWDAGAGGTACPPRRTGTQSFVEGQYSSLWSIVPAAA